MDWIDDAKFDAMLKHEASKHECYIRQVTFIHPLSFVFQIDWQHVEIIILLDVRPLCRQEGDDTLR